MAKLTNAQKNQLIYYKLKGRQYKNEEITPKYLDNLLSSYRELMRPNKTLEKETNDAKLLEQVLNGIKQYQNNYVDSKNYSLEDIVADAALNNLLLNLKEVNPHLFEGAGLITSSTDKVAQGAMLEDFMNEFITTVNAAFQGINFDSGDMIYRTGGMLDAINNKNLIQDIGNDVMQQTIDKFNKVINTAAFKSGKIIDKGGDSTTSRQKYIRKGTFAKVDVTTNQIDSKAIKVDNAGLNYEINITAQATMLEKVVSALSQATFTDKNYLSTKELHLGHTNPVRVFMTVADGDSSYKLYRYARMLNCMANHHGTHNSPELFYRIRAIYELTGGKQKVEQSYLKSSSESMLGDLITGAGRAKYLVVNNPQAGGFLKVIPTAELVKDIEYNLYYNQKLTSGEFLNSAKTGSMSMEQSLYSDISLKFSRIL